MKIKKTTIDKLLKISTLIYNGGFVFLIILLAVLFLAVSNFFSTSQSNLLLDAVLLFLAIIFGNFAYDLLKNFYKTIKEMTQKKQSEKKQ